jgi:fibronectin type 3 domain-containing protein
MLLFAIFKLKNCFLVISVSMLLFFSVVDAEITIGNVSFDDNAFADTILSTNYAGGFGSSPSYVIEGGELDLDEAILGYNLNTWIDYDIPPPGVDPANYHRNPLQYVKVGFRNNTVVNLEGNDIVAFEEGGTNGIYFSLSERFAPESSFISNGNYNAQGMWFCYVDLSDLGVPLGDTIRYIYVSNYPEQGGSGIYYPYGVAEIAGVAAVHSAIPLNQKPEVFAGSPQTTGFPTNSVSLSATVTDDGLPAGGQLNINWQQLSGPSTVQFSNAFSTSTDVTFALPGVYDLQIVVSDGEFSDTSVTTITVREEDLTPPSTPSNCSFISAIEGSLRLQWENALDNIGIAYYNIFRDQQFLAHTDTNYYEDKSVIAYASYSYSVQAVDFSGNLSNLSPPIDTIVTAIPTVLEKLITDGNDDVEEFANGAMQTNSSDLELVFEAGTPQNQIVGLRFANLAIPQYAQIANAYIEFEVDEVTTADASLQIQIEAIDNAAPFTSTARSISSRSFENSTIPWSNVAPWSSVDSKQRTPDISALIQAAVNRTGWSSGNALVVTITGTGTRTAESVEGEAAAAPKLHVEYVPGAPVNHAPVVSAGQSQTIALPLDQVTLAGSVTDDGLPSGNSVSTHWSQVSGPTGVSFQNEAHPTTEAYFPENGVYVLQLLASDGDLQSTATVTITVTAPDLTPPTIPQSLSVVSAVAGSVRLQWNPSTDNNGIIQYEVVRNGSVLSTVTETSFTDATAAAHDVYTYTVEAIDAAGNRSGTSTPVEVTVPGAALTVEKLITDGNDDVEEFANGAMQTNSSDLELVFEAGTPQNQIVGLRFANLAIPQYAQIANAYIEFEVDEVTTADASLQIQIEAIDNAAPFTSTARSISSRSFENSTIPWSNVAPWSSVDSKQRTPDISALIQAAVNRTGWSSGNALVVTITGTGTRTAESVEGEAAAAPKLHVEYVPGAPVNHAPVVSAGQSQTIALPLDQVTLAGSVTDDGLPSGNSVSTHWSQVSGPTGVSFQNEAHPTTEAYFPENGVYVLQLLASDGDLQSTATVTITVTAPDLTPPTIPQSLSVVSAVAGSVRLQWNPSTDNNGIIQYEVVRNGSVLSTVTETSFTDGTAAAHGAYTYTVEAIDAAGNRSGTSTPVSVTVPGAALTVEKQITDGNDDVEEFASGAMQTNSSDLELVYEAGTPQNQNVGLRFANLAIPQYAQIANAYIEFEVDEVTTSATSLQIHIEAVDNAAPFTSTAHSVSSRNFETVTIPWDNVESWSSVDVKHHTPDISALIQAVVNRAGWTSGNSLVISITGTGTRTAESVEGEAAAAPKLHVEYVQ